MKKFQCQSCGECCRQSGFVYLAKEDAERLATHLGMDVYAFTETNCLLMGRKHLALKKHSDETCLFLRGDGCAVYEARPLQCRDFPSNWKTAKSSNYCEGLKRIGSG